MSREEQKAWQERYQSGKYIPRPWPSDLLEQWIGRMPPGRALDVPCGTGRNAVYLAESGFQVDAIDISTTALEVGCTTAEKRGLQIRWRQADLDDEGPPGAPYQLIVSCFYLNRRVIPQMKEWLADGGYVIFEQHLRTPLDVQGPHSDAWKLEPNELLRLFADFRVLHYEEGIFTHEREDGERTNALARLVACKGDTGF